MERRVAKYLQGDRTPSSGAMAKYKGDVTVDFVNNPGKYIIECKLSAGMSRSNQPAIVMTLSWFAKIQQEAAAMRAKFGVLIIHYHKLRDDYVFIRSDHVAWLETKSNRADVIREIILARIEAHDIMRFSNGKTRTLFQLEQRWIENNYFREINGYKAGAVNTPDGTYYIFNLQQFRELMEGV